MSYLNLVHHFFEEFFSPKYLEVSVPFVVLITTTSCIGASYFYLKKIKYYKSQLNILMLTNHQYNQAIQNMQQQQNQRMVVEQPTASAPPIAYLYSYV